MSAVDPVDPEDPVDPVDPVGSLAMARRGEKGSRSPWVPEQYGQGGACQQESFHDTCTLSTHRENIERGTAPPGTRVQSSYLPCRLRFTALALTFCSDSLRKKEKNKAS